MTEHKKRKITTRKNTKIQKKEIVIEQEDGTIEVKKVGKRTPMHKQKAIGIKARPGFVARQVVEKPGRVEQFLDAGYVFCEGHERFDTDDRIQAAKGLGKVCRQNVNFHNLTNGDSPTAVWMEIPEELYEQDQLDKLNRAAEKEKQIDPRKLVEDNPDVYYGAKFKKTYDE